MSTIPPSHSVPHAPYSHPTSHSSSGIGQQTALVFASEGAHVVCADINLEAAQRTVDLIAQDSANKKAIAVKADVGKEDQIKALVGEAVSTFGRLDVML